MILHAFPSRTTNRPSRRLTTLILILIMNNRHSIRIATLNARSFLGGKNPNKTKLLTKYLKPSTPSIDILCLQDISASTANQRLTKDETSQLQFLFPNNTNIFAKYTAIICLNSKYILTDSCISTDNRWIHTTVQDANNQRTVCRLLNTYTHRQMNPYAILSINPYCLCSLLLRSLQNLA